MADQVNPTGGLVTGLPQMLLAAKAQSPPESPRPAKAAEHQANKPSDGLAGQSAKVAESDLNTINQYLEQTNSNLKFKVDDGTGITFFQIVSTSTGEVIRQVPSEEILTMARKLRELSKHEASPGVLVDKEG